MRTPLPLFALLTGLALGCHDGGHDHDHDHDHGGAHSHDGGHGHHHDPPHGGTLVVFGKEMAHIEFVLDAETGKLEAWVLDGSAENGVRVPQTEIELAVEVGDRSETVTLRARSNKLSGEKPGDTSEFEATSPALVGVKEFDATITSFTVKGTEFKAVKFPFPRGNE